jgi:carboxymethylenebutenolidase
VISDRVSIPVDGASMPAFMARPELGSGPHSAVIILPEVYGITPEMERVAALVASAGGVGLAINFYHREHPEFNQPYIESGAQAGLQAARKVTRATLRADVKAAMEWLDQQEFVKRGRIATWGFCIGGGAAFVTATLPSLRGAVCYYGSQIAKPFPSGEPEGLVDAAQIACPLLLVFGDEDPSIPPEQIDRIGRALDDAGKDFTIQVYPHVGHAFFRQGSKAAIAQAEADSDEAVALAVADAWDLTYAFFRQVFKVMR